MSVSLAADRAQEHQTAGIRVLHVPYTYFPDPSGGTEVYVRGLARRLAHIGHPSSVAAPGAVSSEYQHDGLDVCRFATDGSARRELAYGAPDEIASEGFGAIVEKLRPDIVHLHARTAAVSERLVDIAHAAGARVVFTYHTPTVSCARGSMMLFGKQPCDGIIARQRCSACALAAHGVPRMLGALGARIPDKLSARLASAGNGARAVAALRIPGLIDAAHERFHALMSKVDHVVAVCQWVFDVLVRNGVPARKIMLSRQGIADGVPRPTPGPSRNDAGPIRLAYFGRVEKVKGSDLLVQALARVPAANVRLDMFAIVQSGPNAELERLRSHAESDHRLTLYPPVPPEAVRAEMSRYDMVAIPSRGFETGPLVVLESFAAGVPVLGADLGGISEIVRHGIDGILVPPDDVSAWAQAIADLASNRVRIEALRHNIRPPRTINEVAEDMAGLYVSLLRARGPCLA